MTTEHEAKQGRFFARTAGAWLICAGGLWSLAVVVLAMNPKCGYSVLLNLLWTLTPIAFGVGPFRLKSEWRKPAISLCGTGLCVAALLLVASLARPETWEHWDHTAPQRTLWWLMGLTLIISLAPPLAMLCHPAIDEAVDMGPNSELRARLRRESMEEASVDLDRAFEDNGESPQGPQVDSEGKGV